MRKSLVISVTVLVALVVMVAPAAAITGNYVTDNEHPFVGLVVFYDSHGEFIWRCSGSLLSPTVFLTAGHCADTAGGADSARVYFQQDAGAHFNPVTGVDPITGYPETCAGATLGVVCATSTTIYNFDYPGGFPNTHDLGLLILDQPINPGEFGKLAAAGTLTNLATARGTQDTTFTASGYGLSYKNQLQNGKPNVSFRERLMASSKLTNLRSALTDGFNLQTNGNGDDRGGTCNGDSGGPMFLGGFSSNQIVGVTSFGLNSLCRGVDFAYRTDTAAALLWIQSKVSPADWAFIKP